MEVAQRKIDMIKKFQTWKLVLITDIPKSPERVTQHAVISIDITKW
jgi:hypothetical protein